MSAGARVRPGPRLPAAVSVGAAVVLVVVGLVVTLWRPYAPDPGPVATALDELPADLAAAIHRYRAPRVVAALGLELLAVAVPAWFVATRSGRRLLRRVVGTAHDGWRGPARGAAVAAVVSGAGVLVALPVRAWAGIVHDGAWHVRTAGAADWWARLAVGVAIDLGVVAVLGAGLVLLVRRRRAAWPADAVVAGVVVVALATMLWPVTVLPLTTPVVPPGEGPQAQAVRRTIQAAELGDVPVVVAQRSRRDVRSNAVVHGLGPTRRVVVDDTLLDRPVDEVVAVVAHELAHQRHRDVLRGVLGAAVVLAAAAGLLRWAWGRPGVRRRVAGDRAAPHDPRVVAVALAVVAVATPVLEPVALWQSRRVEAAADAAAHDLGATPATTIRLHRRLAIDNLSPMTAPPWQRIRWHSHPTPAARVRAAVARARRDGQQLPTPRQLEAGEAADPPAWEAPTPTS